MTSEAQGARIFGLGSRAARWALGLSLVVNFLVLGVVGGVAMKLGDERHEGRRYHFSRQVIDAAGPDRREAVRALVERERGEGGRDAGREAWRARWTRVIDLIAQTPFDAAALDAAFDESDAKRAASRKGRNAAMVEALSLLTEDERAALADDMRTHLEKRASRD